MFMNLIFTRKWNIIGNTQVPHMGPGYIIQSILYYYVLLYTTNNTFLPFFLIANILQSYILNVITGQIEYCPLSTTRPRSR